MQGLHAEMIYRILNVLRNEEEVKKTDLILKTNTTTKWMKTYVKILQKDGLIEEGDYKPREFYDIRITPKGFLYLKKYEELQEAMK